MDIECLKFMLILAFADRIRCLPLACSYNGTSFKEGESVKTEEPCLSCVCQKGALECNLRVCAEYPNLLPPSCFLVHKPNNCCPQLFCEERFSPDEVEVRTGFKLETRLHGNDCVINGSLYAEGSAVASSRVCEYCYCVEGEMKCIKPRCLQSFEGCKAVYEKSSCCPTHYDCRDADVNYLTIQIKNAGKINPAVTSDSLRSLSNTVLSSEKVYVNASESVAAASDRSERLPVEDESEKTTTEEIYSEETTAESEKEQTAPSTEDGLTTLGFQTTRIRTFIEGSTNVAFTEITTLEPDSDVNISTSTAMISQKETSSVQTRSKMDFRAGIESSADNRDNSSSQSAEDYDSYDYSEPRLPPSLPNLVIFPFVAADAVVKDESADVPTMFEKIGIERFDTHPVFYKDYFSPPLKTEGGFVPKEPSVLEKRFYEYVHFKREQMEPPSAGLRENPEVQVQASPSSSSTIGNCVYDVHGVQHKEILTTSADCVTCTCQQGVIVCQDVECPQLKPETNVSKTQEGIKVTSNATMESNSSVAPDQTGEAVQPDTEITPDFILKDESTTFHDRHQTKKPVTVTYKNLVVDFYPNFLITTARGNYKSQSVESEAQKISERESQHQTQKIQDTIASLSTTSRPLFSYSDEKDTSISAKATFESPIEKIAVTMSTTVPKTTSETSFFDEFIKSFLSMEATPEAVTATAKHKYFSKNKGQTVTTIKPKQEEIREKVKFEVGNVYSTTDAYTWLNSISRQENVTQGTKNHSTTRQSVKKDDMMQMTNIPLNQKSESLVDPVEASNVTIKYYESLAEANSSGENREDSAEAKGIGMKSNSEGALFKLAGCNIYGMMYRVGKIILELSGPCLECLCTELGVQCKALKC